MQSAIRIEIKMATVKMAGIYDVIARGDKSHEKVALYSLSPAAPTLTFSCFMICNNKQTKRKKERKKEFFFLKEKKGGVGWGEVEETDIGITDIGITIMEQLKYNSVWWYLIFIIIN